MKRPHLTLRSSVRIHDRKAGLTEPSGLSLDPDSGRLWTVSDGHRRLFEMDRKGRVRSVRKLSLKKSDPEGVTALSGGRVAVVCERRSRIAIFDRKTGRCLTAGRLPDMAGAGALPGGLRTGKAGRNGLEGITFNPTSGTFFAIGERSPRVLIEVSQDLDRVISVRRLSAGFGPKSADISGLTWDPRRAAFWILSDTGRRVFLFDPRTGRVRGCRLMRKDKPVRNAEGVALSKDGKTLFVVADAGKKSRLLRYRID
ncbi:MAG: SdiA-regulated domain-containing protein [Marinibacterium sp.]